MKRPMTQKAFAARLSYIAITSIALLAFLLGMRISQISPGFTKWVFPDSVWAAKQIAWEAKQTNKK